MKRLLTIMLVLVLTLSISVSCSKDNKDENPGNGTGTEEKIDNTDDKSNDDDEIATKSEDEDTDMVIKPEKADVSEFLGSWSADSDKAKYMYGNFELTINKDGTWNGNITDEDLSGTWVKSGKYIVCSSDLFTFNVLKSTNGNIVMQETDDAVRVVLTKR